MYLNYKCKTGNGARCGFVRCFGIFPESVIGWCKVDRINQTQENHHSDSEYISVNVFMTLCEEITVRKSPMSRFRLFLRVSWFYDLDHGSLTPRHRPWYTISEFRWQVYLPEVQHHLNPVLEDQCTGTKQLNLLGLSLSIISWLCHPDLWWFSMPNGSCWIQYIFDSSYKRLILDYFIWIIVVFILPPSFLILSYCLLMFIHPIASHRIILHQIIRPDHGIPILYGAAP